MSATIVCERWVEHCLLSKLSADLSVTHSFVNTLMLSLFLKAAFGLYPRSRHPWCSMYLYVTGRLFQINLVQLGPQNWRHKSFSFKAESQYEVSRSLIPFGKLRFLLVFIHSFIDGLFWDIFSLYQYFEWYDSEFTELQYTHPSLPSASLPSLFATVL